MPAKKILIVDDLEESCKLLSEILGAEYECTYTSESTTAVDYIKHQKPDLVLLDYSMPGMMGVDICKILREDQNTKSVPIIFISGAANIEDRVNALENGADDFISKPFHSKELIWRVKARLNDKDLDHQTELAAANLKLNLLSRQTFLSGEEILLTPKQFEIVRLLMENKNNLVKRETFLEEIWGNTEVTSRNVDSQINYLKKKLENFAGKITPVPSLGYRLEVKE